jgi:hypothetical protein
MAVSTAERHLDLDALTPDFDALALDAGPQCIQILINAGGRPECRQSCGKTPLAVVNRNNPLVIDLLRNLGFTE